MRTIPTTCTTAPLGTPTCILAESGYTSLALALNLEMYCDDAAQARYEAIWGVPWQPLPMPGSDTSFAPSTRTGTR